MPYGWLWFYKKSDNSLGLEQDGFIASSKPEDKEYTISKIKEIHESTDKNYICFIATELGKEIYFEIKKRGNYENEQV